MTSDPIKQAWQASASKAAALPLEDVRKGAGKFHRYIKWRNGVEYAACIFVVVSFSTYVVTMPYVLQKLGSALIVLATFYVAWQLHARASAERSPEAGTLPIYIHLRTQLVRQHAALKGVFRWYIAPFLPGFVLMSVGAVAEHVAEGAGAIVRGIIGASIMALLVLFVWWLNQLAARKLQRHIDEIDTLVGE